MRRHHRRTRCGAAAVELAATLPLLLMLLMGIWEVGRFVQVNQILSNAAREGARLAASGQASDAQVKMAVCQYIKSAGLKDYTGNPDAYVTVTNVTENGIDSRNALTLDQLRVQVSIPSADVRWIAMNYFMSPSYKIVGKADWRSSKNRNYPSTIVSPAGF